VAGIKTDFSRQADSSQCCQASHCN